MSKGISFIGVVLLALITLIIAEFVILQTAIVDSSELIRAVRETAIAEDINNLEFIKRAQKPALSYSFYGSYYFLGKRGGYFELTNIKSYDCVPYWQVYDEKNYPSFSDLVNNFQSTIEKMFDNYLKSIGSDETFIPYHKITIKNMPASEPFPNEFDVEVKGSKNLMFESKYVKIEDKSDFTSKVSSGLLYEYKNAVAFLEANDFQKIVSDAINELNLKTSCSLTKSNLPSDEEVFSDTDCNGMSFSQAKSLIENKIKEKINKPPEVTLPVEIMVTTAIEPSCSYIKSDSQYTKNCNFEFEGANILVVVKSEKTYPLGDGVKNFEFKFRILVGRKIKELELFNSCQEKL